jgi:hypothetical protein
MSVMKQLPQLTKEELKEAITEGIYRAFWDMIRLATDLPCADFYAAVEDGVARALTDLKREGKS